MERGTNRRSKRRVMLTNIEQIWWLENRNRRAKSKTPYKITSGRETGNRRRVTHRPSQRGGYKLTQRVSVPLVFVQTVYYKRQHLSGLYKLGCCACIVISRALDKVVRQQTRGHWMCSSKHATSETARQI